MILITGANGFIGSHLVKLFDNPICVDKENSNEIIKFIESDLSYRDVKCVYHLGANSSTTETDTSNITRNNMLLSCELLEGCIAKNIPFIYASSASVYGLGSTGFKEDTLLTPLNYYAISKAYFDTVVNQKITDNPEAKIIGLRYFNVYGSGEDSKGDMASPIHKFLNQANENGEIKIFEGSQNYLRDFIHVSDVVRTTKDAINLPSGIYNVGTGNARSFLDVANIISAITGADIKEIPFPDYLTGKYQEYTCSNNAKLINACKSFQRLSLEAGIAEVTNVR